MKTGKLTKSILAVVAIAALAVPGIVFAQTDTVDVIAKENVQRLKHPGS